MQPYLFKAKRIKRKKQNRLSFFFKEEQDGNLVLSGPVAAQEVLVEVGKEQRRGRGEGRAAGAAGSRSRGHSQAHALARSHPLPRPHPQARSPPAPASSLGRGLRAGQGALGARGMPARGAARSCASLVPLLTIP